MRRSFLFITLLFIYQVAFCQTTYTFTGNGYWTVASNWSNNTIPPSILSAGNTININPAAGDSCILNTSETIADGASFTIFPNAIFVILGGMIITGGLPTVTTDTFYTSTAVEAIGRGAIIANGESEIISKGFVWDTLPAPALDHSNIILQEDTFATLFCRINNLLPATTYYLKAFASNSKGTGYGTEKSITVPPLPPVPLVYTDTAGEITTTSARGGGIVNGTSVTAYGLVWDTLPGLSITLASKTVNTNMSDTFINYINSLQPGKTYYTRAYATNRGGTGYGEERSFTTLAAAAGDSSFTDPRDGQVYTFRHIGTQVWMAKNLNYATAAGSWCSGNDAANCNVYGKLYTWNAAMIAAPPGWHLPGVSELLTLMNYLGGYTTAGGKMKEAGTGHWLSPNTGADNSSGFTALPGGNRSSVGGAYQFLGTVGSWWSADYYSDLAAYALRIDYNSVVANPGTSAAKGVGNSVRCIRNN